MKSDVSEWVKLKSFKCSDSTKRERVEKGTIVNDLRGFTDNVKFVCVSPF